MNLKQNFPLILRWIIIILKVGTELCLSKLIKESIEKKTWDKCQLELNFKIEFK